MKIGNWSLVLVALGTMGWSAACHKTLDITASGGTGSSSGGHEGVLPDCSKGTPPVTKGGAMKHVGLLDGACFWIDETEVTQGDYAAFLADVAMTAPPAIDSCAGTVLDPAMEGSCVAAATGDDQPQACVDWCSAAIYCAWAGKRLCQGDDAPADATTSEWYSACSHGNQNAYPNGDKASAAGCNVAGGPTDPVGANPACATPEGALDMVGNVAEWVDECAGDDCGTRGGSFNTANAACSSSNGKPRALRLPDLGFRCCAADPGGGGS